MEKNKKNRDSGDGEKSFKKRRKKGEDSVAGRKKLKKDKKKKEKEKIIKIKTMTIPRIPDKPK